MNKSPIDKTVRAIKALNTNTQIRLLLTNSCPHMCSWCHMEGDKRGSVFMDYYLLEAIIDALPYNQRKLITMVLSGGEPLIHPEIESIVERVGKAGFAQVHLVSNGVKPKLLQRLADNLDVIKIHLESYDSAFYKFIHGVPIDKVREALSLLEPRHSHKIVIESPVNRVSDVRNLLTVNSERSLVTKLLEIKPEDGLTYPRFDSIVGEVINLGYSRVADHDPFTQTWVKRAHTVYVSRKCSSLSKDKIFIDSSGFVYQSLSSGQGHLDVQAA